MGSNRTSSEEGWAGSMASVHVCANRSPGSHTVTSPKAYAAPPWTRATMPPTRGSTRIPVYDAGSGE